MTTEWQPISTCQIKPFQEAAPWEGSDYVLLYTGKGLPKVGKFNYTSNGKGRWTDHVRIIEPTHWMPLPSPPAAGE